MLLYSTTFVYVNVCTIVSVNVCVDVVTQYITVNVCVYVLIQYPVNVCVDVLVQYPLGYKPVSWTRKERRVKTCPSTARRMVYQHRNTSFSKYFYHIFTFVLSCLLTFFIRRQMKFI